MPFEKYPSKVSAESFAPLQTVISSFTLPRQLNVLMIISDSSYDHSNKDMPDLSSQWVVSDN